MDKKYYLEDLLEKFKADALLVEKEDFPYKDDFNLPLAFVAIIEAILEVK